MPKILYCKWDFILKPTLYHAQHMIVGNTGRKSSEKNNSYIYLLDFDNITCHLFTNGFYRVYFEENRLSGNSTGQSSSSTIVQIQILN